MSDEHVLVARKSLATIFKAFQQVGQGVVAQRLSLSDATISNWKNKDAETVSQILAAAGLKVVPSGHKCYEPRQMEAILTLAKAHLGQLDNTSSLQWEDE